MIKNPKKQTGFKNRISVIDSNNPICISMPDAFPCAAPISVPPSSTINLHNKPISCRYINSIYYILSPIFVRKLMTCLRFSAKPIIR